MFIDVGILQNFYNDPLGKAVQYSIKMALSCMWPQSGNHKLLGIGFSVPYLEHFAEDKNLVINFMPAAQGSTRWPYNSNNLTALVYEEQLPLPDSSMDYILMVHFLEQAKKPEKILKEFWRVLAPYGYLILVVPNSTGLWAWLQNTPFALGHSFSSNQLSRLLKNNYLTPVKWEHALFFLPRKQETSMNFNFLLEKYGRKFFPKFSGVILVKAIKKVSQGKPLSEKSLNRSFGGTLVPECSACTVHMPFFNINRCVYKGNSTVKS